MKPSSSQAKDDGDRKTAEHTPSEGSTLKQPPSPARPGLIRSPPGRLSDLSQSLGESQQGRQADGKEDAVPQGAEGDSQDVKAKGRKGRSSEEERLEKLRDAVNAKLLLQQRARRSYGSSKGDQTVPNRVSPIVEEDHAGMSPTIASAFASPPPAISRTGSTVSTESTESSKTVRASNPATPAAAQAPMRTPSYPFPYVPGTPKPWQSGFHQPFMSLSPTVSGEHLDESQRHRGSVGNVASGGSTPMGTSSAFMPGGSYFQGPEDPRYPTPNLYDMVLQLNSEPGMEQWWMTVTNLMHDNFCAERVTLVIPLDPTDIENVPWGQKASFSMNGPEEFVPPRTLFEQTMQSTTEDSGTSRPGISLREPSTEANNDNGRQKLHPERLRPRIESRHSYAGHGRETKEAPQRPAGPQRTATHAAGVPTTAGMRGGSYRRLLSSSNVRHGSMSDPEFSSVAGGGGDAGPYAEVFPTLRNLDHEVRPLIEAGGVNRVLERGKVVAITRDYNSSYSDDSDASGASAAGDTSTTEPTPSAPRKSTAKLFGNYRSVFASENGPSLLKDYDEYEQTPASPWSQSPAPSPAIQADEETNPFFASEEQQIEDSFNDASTPKDYSQFGQVEAIGVEHASTVIHIPLVHPTLSQPMQSLRHYNETDDDGAPKRSNTIDMTRKAPVAILSILSSAVPYPHNLSQILKLLGPHLATSFAISQQFSSTHLSAVSIRHRRTASGHQTSTAPMTIVPTSLEDLVTTDLEEQPGSMSGSVTSPSDYSGRSRHSPGGSIVGTPGWDPASHGWISSKSVSGTPGVTGAEMIDNYFEAKKRQGQRSGSNASAQVQSTPVRSARKTASSDAKSSQKTSPEEGKDSSRDATLKANMSAVREKTPVRPATGKEPGSAEASSPQRPPMRHSISTIAEVSSEKRHSQLHSYGADFQSSFGPLPSAATTEPHSGGVMGHGRKNSWSEEMPPPSERLLRTIIDSVPVQIFTAEPDTGKMTWLNSKFVIYRGQEAREVLSDPWAAIHPDDRSDFMSSWHRSLRTAQQLQQKVRLERFDGSYRWFYVRAAPLKDKRQKIVHWIGTMMDFHEQQIAEMNSARQQETAASEAKYRALANSSPQIVFAVNKSKGVIFCNSQWVHFSGQSEQQALGLGFMDQVHPDDLVKCKLPMFDSGSSRPRNVPMSMPPDLSRNPSTSNASSGSSDETERGGGTYSSRESSPVTAQNSQMPQRKLSELAGTGILKVSKDADGRPSYSTEVRLKSKDGEFRWHLVRVLLAEPLAQVGEDEEVWYGTCTDINDHKTLERDLKETMDEKSRFLSNMSHEIRTPLNGITGMVNFLIDSSLTTEQMEHVNIIRASTEGLRGLINDILDLSKAEAGMIQLNMDWLYVRALIEEVNDLTSTMAIDKGLELNYVVDNDVPPQVKGDRFRIRQVLLNIIGNAIKFTQKGEVFVHCSTVKNENFDLAQNEIQIKFEVVDTGRGFTEKEAEFLFKRFSQIDGSSTRQHGGSGLGLVISRQLAQLHGGDMSATGVLGKGSTFTLTIKTTLPSKYDQPPEPVPTPGGVHIPMLPQPSPAPAPIPSIGSKLSKVPSMSLAGGEPPRSSPKFGIEQSQSPSPYESPMGTGKDSPSVSSASSDPSVRSATRTGSLRSERSSASSYVPENPSTGMKLALPSYPKLVKSDSLTSQDSAQSGALTPPMFSILVVCPLKHAREATVQHIDQTLPSTIPHQITPRESLEDCEAMLGGEDPVLFTHVVAVLQDVDEIVALMSRVFSSPAHTSSSIVIITDLAQRRKIMELAPQHDYDRLAAELRLRFVFKPLKPSRFAAIFDPGKEREMSTDRNQDSAQQVALSQKQVFEELSRRLGNRDKRVLLVEDNKTNQLVSH